MLLRGANVIRDIQWENVQGCGSYHVTWESTLTALKTFLQSRVLRQTQFTKAAGDEATGPLQKRLKLALEKARAGTAWRAAAIFSFLESWQDRFFVIELICHHPSPEVPIFKLACLSCRYVQVGTMLSIAFWFWRTCGLRMNYFVAFPTFLTSCALQARSDSLVVGAPFIHPL